MHLPIFTVSLLNSISIPQGTTYSGPGGHRPPDMWQIPSHPSQALHHHPRKGQMPFDSEFIGLQRVKLFSMFFFFRKSRADAGRKMPDNPHPNVLAAAPATHFFQKMYHPMRNERLGKVPNFGDRNLNIA